MQAAVAQTVDRLDMHATATALLLDVQDKLGDLSREALRITASGRRPFRPTPGWESALAELAFSIFSIADQTGIDLEQAVKNAISRMAQPPQGAPQGHPGGGPGGPGGPGDGSGRPDGPGPDARVRPDGWPLSY